MSGSASSAVMIASLQDTCPLVQELPFWPRASVRALSTYCNTACLSLAALGHQRQQDAHVTVMLRGLRQGETGVVV